MADYWLSKAGAKLLAQVNAAYPKRDHASDGWIGDASHAATASDHNPCWTCSGERYGVVRAVDFDASFGGHAGYNTTADAWRFAKQLRDAMVAGDGRLSYVIAYDPDAKQTKIASMNPSYRPLGVFRNYSGDSHENHVHVSFTALGDLRDGAFDVPMLKPEPKVDPALKRLRDRIKARLADAKKALAAVLAKIKRQKS